MGKRGLWWWAMGWWWGGQAINKDAKTETVFDERSTIEFMSTSQLED